MSLPRCPELTQLGEVYIDLGSPARSLSDVLERKRGSLNEAVSPDGRMTQNGLRRRGKPQPMNENLHVFGDARGGVCPR